MSYSHTAATRIDQSPCTKQFHARPNQIRAIRHGIGVDSRHGSLWEHLHACYVVLKSYLQNEALKPKLCQPFTYQARCTRRTPWTALLPNRFECRSIQSISNSMARVLQLQFSPQHSTTLPTGQHGGLHRRSLLAFLPAAALIFLDFPHDYGHRGHPWANVTWKCLSSLHLLQL